ncbi:Nucleoside diphosphate kinase 6, variant 2 [Balamuthia mandrillaris]
MNATRKQLTLALIKPDVLLASFPKQSLPSVQQSVASAFANNRTHNSATPTRSGIENNPFRGIVDLIRRNGFEVLDWKTLQLSIEDAERFYGEHEGRFFYQRLVSFITRLKSGAWRRAERRKKKRKG